MDSWDKWLKAAEAWYEDRAHMLDDRLEFKMPSDPRFRTKNRWRPLGANAGTRELGRQVRRCVNETFRCLAEREKARDMEGR